MTFREVRLPYGEGFLTVKIPEKNLVYVLKTREVAGCPDEGEAIVTALKYPIGSLPLTARIKKTDKVVVIVTDYTRPCPEDRILPPLLKELETVIPRENITIMVALGLHPPMDREGMVKRFGENIVANYRVINHDVDDTVNLGTTTRGTPVDINHRVVEANFRISTGFVEPHLFAGFSGGRKSIAPGVFSVNSAYHNHGFKMIESPNARPGVLKNNPIHEDMVEIAKKAKLDFIVNVLMNSKREIVRVFAGDMVKAHEVGCEAALKTNGFKVPNKVDIAITTNSGAPLDLDLYQTVKGVETASRVVRNGGIIISASACYAGVGPDSYHGVHAASKTPEEVLRKLRDSKPEGVPWENQILARIQMKHRIYLVSKLDNRIVNDFMITPVASIEEALKKALEVMGTDAKIAVIPEGPQVIPLFDGIS